MRVEPNFTLLWTKSIVGFFFLIVFFLVNSIGDVDASRNEHTSILQIEGC